ncbi:MAG TPA: hypothetical protein P5567_11530 [Kiritimatiellia bacterium]|nr:hypothetical protein [Kiritimatiellia bacterium]HSA17492.1 hypothetical protein [Kiritimatiellia bacterium]
MILAIDPGQSGGIAWMDDDGVVNCADMLPTAGDIIDHLRMLKAAGREITAYLEKTGGYVPGNSGPAACKFARGCGLLEGAIMALAIPLVEVAPGVWMKTLGSLPSDKRARKNAIKGLMQARYPHLKITLSTADALGLLTYALEKRAS